MSKQLVPRNGNHIASRRVRGDLVRHMDQTEAIALLTCLTANELSYLYAYLTAQATQALSEAHLIQQQAAYIRELTDLELATIQHFTLTYLGHMERLGQLSAEKLLMVVSFLSTRPRAPSFWEALTGS